MEGYVVNKQQRQDVNPGLSQKLIIFYCTWVSLGPWRSRCRVRIKHVSDLLGSPC